MMAVENDMDATSQRLYGRPRTFHWRDSAVTYIEARNHLGRFAHIAPRLSVRSLLDTMGVPNGARLRVQLEPSGPITVSADLETHGLELLSNAVINENGQWQLVIHNVQVAPGYRHRGLAGRIALHALTRAAAIGFHEVGLIADRDSDRQGYFVWPVFGFDGDLRDQPEMLERIRKRMRGERLPEHLPAVRTVRDVLERSNGLTIWKELGDTLWMTFDLRRDSPSWQVFRAYSRRKGLRLATGWQR
jgi:ribosomal protein S18 acetylase RimI-like enzyme